ncbi:hypothetical protein IBE48_09520 [Francisella philomiragia]|uniref:Sel1 repeat family protein n=1 Tax=Francisella philomiragia TaxID=28110 RepID=A0AAW3DE79_9GAMM|nr:hypothetical protein [Francisella philomiragia]KFJ44122.1 hypothetical protein DR78_1963 [Francisella philomiragia]MBK2255688.1 hypothetical protein [Francisella philomiragia]MBK2274001.1 hypothetical protein [Francisella philomiragia]MBK2277842.1 hypothetical protein [Francisella philomiragia]MBK2281788.1 hypothetical protein [Francisella philomiragia]
MKKNILFIIIVFFYNFSFSNTIIKHIDSATNDQIYCIKGKESSSIKSFLDKYSKYGFNECLGNDFDEKDFIKLEELAKSNPKYYDYYLGMAYFLGYTPNNKRDLNEARKLFSESISLGDKKSGIMFCNTITEAKDAFQCYSQLENNEKYLNMALLYRPTSEKYCYYIDKLDVNKDINFYPLVMSCKLSQGKIDELSKENRYKLLNIIKDKKTGFSSKLISAEMLNNKKYILLLNELVSGNKY